MSNMNNTDTQAIEQFLPAANKYSTLYASKPHISTHYSKDDLLSEVYLVLHKGNKEYKEDQGMKYTTYMIQRIKWRLMELDRICAKKALKGDGMVLSLSAMEGSKSDNWHPSIEYDYDTLSMLDILSDRDKDIIIRHTVNDETFESIAASYNVSGTSIINWHNSALEFLKESSI